jgi:chromosome partitioning protein
MQIEAAREAAVHVLVLCATKGGVAKSTLSACLAVEAAKTLRVGIYDCDPQASLRRWLELRETPGNIALITARSPRDAVGAAHARGIDLLIVDTPPAIMSAIRPAVTIGDLILIPCRPTPTDIDAVDASVELARLAEKQFAFVLSMVPTQGGQGLTSGARKYMQQSGPVCTTLIHQRLAYAGAMGTGQTGPEMEPKCAEEITALWGEVKRKLAATAKQ